ncbi:MAG: S41 family peptidase [Saprospiraceae bacterium]
MINAQTIEESNQISSETRITSAERIFGLVQFWSEAKYTFTYFDQVSKLDWDAALQEYIPLVQNAESDDAYYRLLEQFCALLKNVNTNIFRPDYLAGKWDRPQLGIELLENVPVVVNRSKEIGNKVPLGAQITSINQMPVETYLEQHIYPYITAGGEQVERRWATHDIMKGPAGSTLNFTFKTLDGNPGRATLPRNRSSKAVVWEVQSPKRPLVKFDFLQGQVGLLTINSFKDEKVTEEFLKHLPNIRKCQKLVLDLRWNMAGNTEVAYEILKYFTNKPILSTAWQTRMPQASSSAWGKALTKAAPETLNEQDRYNQQMYWGEIWHVVPADTIQPASNPIPEIPIAVLMSNYTASAAEKFLVAADVLENLTYIGEPSFGDTPQQSTLSLPGGGSARISSKRDTYPDGKVYVGPGVAVDLNIAPSIKDYLEDRDVVLAKALEILK